MDISEFIFKGQIKGIKIGDSISNSKMNLEELTSEEDDIPSLHTLEVNSDSFQITCLKNTVIGLSFDFEYETEKMYNLNIKSKNFQIGFKTKLADFENFLKDTNTKYLLADSQNEDSKEIYLTESKVSLRFVNSDFINLCKAHVFDLALYQKLRTI
nr:hypothetical protein [uncultured Flavobacterium sp.]